MRISLIPERVAARAAARPGAVAVEDLMASLSYGQLMGQADQVARRLLASGVTPGQLVAVCLDRGAPLVVALLGVLRAGCAYLPLDPEYPPERLRFMIENSGSAAIVANPDALARLAPVRVTAVDMTATGPVAGEGTALPPVGARDLAYVAYTSGSTGTPKGVAVEHGNVARLFDAVGERIPVTESDAWACCHSVAFDFSVWEIWGALTSGGRLVMVSRAETRDPAELLARLRSSRTTLLSATPSAFQRLLSQLGAEPPAWSVRAVILGGEAVSVGAVTDVLRAPPGSWPRLYNLYGITETTVHATVRELTASDLGTGVRSPIGSPLADLRLAVLDPARQRVPPGEAGELWVGGAGVARGYVGLPGLTAERFVTGLLPEHGAATRWYRSGDLARQLPSGEFEYIGRIDRQVKVRGFRIEPGEIEAVLVGHPAVAAAAVKLRDGSLAAYLVARPPGVALEDVHEWLAARLPAHMIPATFTALDSLPVTANGKADLESLDQVPARPLPRRAQAEEPRTATEARLSAIWSSVLGSGQIGRHDNFFAVGGDSMLALRVAAAAGESGMPLAVRDIFTNPTLAGLASVVEGSGRSHPGAGEADGGRRGAGAGPAAAAVPDAGADLLIPASQMQRGMLFEHARNPDSSTYHVVSALRVSAARPFAEQDVLAALGRLAQDNPALRTRLDLLHYPSPMQVIHAAPEVRLRYLDVSALDGGEQERQIGTVFAAEQAHRFTEHDYPLWRVACVQVSAQAAEVMLVHHHAILDGWSVARFFDQLIAALSALPYQTAPVSVLEAAVRLEHEAVRSTRASEFWRSQAKTQTPLPLTRRTSPPADATVVSAQIRADAPFRAAIRTAAARWQCAPKHVYLAAHLRALARFAHWDDYAATGVVVNGRPELPNAHNALGMFLNVVPLSVTGFGASWAELVHTVAAAEVRIQPYRWFPQATMVTELGMLPLKVCFNYTDFSATAMHGFLTRVTETSPNGIPLTVSVVDDGLVVEASAWYFSAQECTLLSEWHRENLHAAIAESRQPERAGSLGHGDRA